MGTSNNSCPFGNLQLIPDRKIILFFHTDKGCSHCIIAKILVCHNRQYMVQLRGAEDVLSLFSDTWPLEYQ